MIIIFSIIVYIKQGLETVIKISLFSIICFIGIYLGMKIIDWVCEGE